MWTGNWTRPWHRRVPSRPALSDDARADHPVDLRVENYLAFARRWTGATDQNPGVSVIVQLPTVSGLGPDISDGPDSRAARSARPCTRGLRSRRSPSTRGSPSRSARCRRDPGAIEAADQAAAPLDAPAPENYEFLIGDADGSSDTYQGAVGGRRYFIERCTASGGSSASTQTLGGRRVPATFRYQFDRALRRRSGSDRPEFERAWAIASTMMNERNRVETEPRTASPSRRKPTAALAMALVVDGKQRDLGFVPPRGPRQTIVTATDELGREIMRHSTAHVLAQAVLGSIPGAKYSIGPPIEDGFYYDFEVERPFTPEDLEPIEAEMKKIVKENQRFERAEIERDEALEIFADQPYKVEIIEGVAEARRRATEQQAAEGEVISIYRNTVTGCRRSGVRRPLSRPPRSRTGRIKAFKLLRTAGAYWRGDENKPMLQRIYGTAWESKDALERLPPSAGGGREARSPQARPRARAVLVAGGGRARRWRSGTRTARSCARSSRTCSRRCTRARLRARLHAAHREVDAVGDVSGHLGFYGENMFPPMEVERREYYVKPMNCPFHVLIYRSKTRSYRELPIRLRGARHRLPLRTLGRDRTGCSGRVASRRTTRTSSAAPIRSSTRWSA